MPANGTGTGVIMVRFEPVRVCNQADANTGP